MSIDFTKSVCNGQTFQKSSIYVVLQNGHLYPIIVILSIISIICPPDSFSLKLRHASLILKFLLTDFYCGWYDGYLQTNGGPVKIQRAIYTPWVNGVPC